MARTIRIFSLLLSLLCFSELTLAQGPSRIPKDQVALEGMFIEAKKLSLIGKTEDALRKYEEILEKDPENDVAFYEKARCHDELDQQSEASKYFKEAIKINPLNSWYYEVYAEHLEKTTQYAEAMGVFTQLTKNFPKVPKYFTSLAFNQMRLGEWKSATVSLEKYIDLVGPTERSSLKLFDLYVRLQDEDKAIQSIESFLVTEPDNTSALHHLGQYYQTLKLNKKAADVYKRIISIDSDDASAQLFLAEQGNSSDAETVSKLNQFMANPSMDVDEKIRKLIPYMEQYVMKNDVSLESELKISVESLVGSHPYSPKAHAISGDFFTHKGNLPKAADSYQSSLKYEKSNYVVWEQLIHILKETYDYQGMTDYASQALDLFPNKAELLYLSSFGNYKLEKYSKATNTIEEYSMILSRDAAAQYRSNLLKAQILVAQDKDANNYFDKAIHINSAAPAAHLEYALAFLVNDKTKEAQRQLEGLEMNSPRAYAISAMLSAKSGYDDQAESSFTKSLEMLREPEVIEWYGDYKFQKGEKEYALELWKEASALLHNKDTNLTKKINGSLNP